MEIKQQLLPDIEVVVDMGDLKLIFKNDVIWGGRVNDGLVSRLEHNTTVTQDAYSAS